MNDPDAPPSDDGVAPHKITGADRVGRAASAYPPPILRRRIPKTVFISAVVLGIVLRISVSTLGHNFDLDSFVLVASIVEAGDNVYAETSRYNYGPVWLNVIGIAARLARLSTNEVGLFQLILSGLLTLVDLGLCLLLRRRAGDGVALLFFLNPVSIIISGFHRQFGNLALLLGLVAADLFDRSPPDRFDHRKCLGVAVLGLSLATKHILFAFPLWLAFKQRRPLHRAAVLVVPPFLFLLSFAPYWSTGGEGIIGHVFLYRSFANAPLWFGAIPHLIASTIPATLVMLAALVAAGFIFRRLSAVESVLLYMAVLLVFSPAMANQYLALAMPFAAWFLSPFSIAYCGAASALLAVSSDGLAMTDAISLQWIQSWGFSIVIGVLLLALAWPFSRDAVVAAARRIGTATQFFRGS